MSFSYPWEVWTCIRTAVTDPRDGRAGPALPVMLIKRHWLGPALEYKAAYEPIEDEA